MWGTNFSSANLIRANFTKATLVGVIFRKANLHSANFDRATIGETDFTDAKLRRAKLSTVKKIENCILQSAMIDETTELRADILQEIEAQRAEPAGIVT